MYVFTQNENQRKQKQTLNIIYKHFLLSSYLICFVSLNRFYILFFFCFFWLVSIIILCMLSLYPVICLFGHIHLSSTHLRHNIKLVFFFFETGWMTYFFQFNLIKSAPCTMYVHCAVYRKQPFKFDSFCDNPCVPLPRRVTILQCIYDI